MTELAFPRRVLLAVTGLTPQIVTETLYALAVQAESRFIPTEIHIISTQEGAERARLSLLDPAIGKFHALCKDYGLQGIQFSPKNIHVIEDASGHPLSDIRTPEDNLRAADFILHYVREFCHEENSMLHVSIAGGRKSMGFFAGYALSLFGRPWDHLSHVLVNEPFEALPDFYFPPLEGKVLVSRDNRPVHTSNARIMLADIPFVRLRGGLQNPPSSFHETVKEVQAGIHFVSLSFNIDKRIIYCGGKAVELPPAQFAFYLWLARRQVNTSGDGAFSVRCADHREFLDIYAGIVGRLSPYFEQCEKALKAGFDMQFIVEKKSKINSRIAKQLPLEASIYQIGSFGERNHKKYGLKLGPDKITFDSLEILT